MADKPNGSLSLDDFTLENESDLVLRKKNGEPSGWTWTFAGPGHPVTVETEARVMRRLLQIQEEQEKARVNGRKWKGSGETDETFQARQIEYIIGRLLRWSDGITTRDGQPFACTPENARLILTNKSMTVYEQANTFLTDERAFMQRSATT